MNAECATCGLLEACSHTDEKKILSHYVCGLYQIVTSAEVVKARIEIISKFGSAGLKALIPPKLEEE